ncbi:DUF6246 family protein [Erwinia aphidicola]|uniref:DUF6246 family protein n=1 Tax=Erwinia aphidicola TaxID=68334 RepID=UPI0030D32894
MTPYKEIGECLITAGEDEYFFRPSFAAMSRIGEPQDIVQAFYDVHYNILQNAYQAYGMIPQWVMDKASSPDYVRIPALASMAILQACCDIDLGKLIGEIVPSKSGRSGRAAFVYRKGVMPLCDMILIAQSLITHGIIGKAKVRQLQRHESNKATTEFNAFEYISAARNHFGMSRDEAEQLSMTEFQMMLAAKYPDQKGFTRDEYEAVADDYLAKKARRLAKAL